MWPSPDFSLKANSKSHYHNCKKDLKAASGTSLPCPSLFCEDEEGGERGATAGRALERCLKLADHDLDKGPPFLLCLISILMREVRIRPRVRASSSDCGAPYPPWVVGLSQIISWTGGRRGVRSSVLCAHEADAGQRACWSGEREGTAKVAGPDGAAEWGGVP